MSSTIAQPGEKFDDDNPLYRTWTWAVVGLCADSNDMRGPEARAWCTERRDTLIEAFRAGVDPIDAYNALVDTTPEEAPSSP